MAFIFSLQLFPGIPKVDNDQQISFYVFIFILLMPISVTIMHVAVFRSIFT